MAAALRLPLTLKTILTSKVAPMNDPQKEELEQMALSAELARQVVHDCSNFLYNVLLQAELLAKRPQDDRPDWSGLKHEAKRLANRIQEWHHYGTALNSEKHEIELNSVVRDVVTELMPEGCFALGPTQAPLHLTTLPGETKRLVCFLLQAVLVPSEFDNSIDSPPLIETEKKAETILLRISGIPHAGDALRGLPGRDCDSPEIGRPTLVIDACKSIAIRLDAKIYLENEAGRPVALLVEFPLDLR
jgi:hypothetical protein